MKNFIKKLVSIPPIILLPLTFMAFWIGYVLGNMLVAAYISLTF